MHISTRFSNQQIVRFCEATRDDNPIHKPEYMNAQGKYVVVPGMLLFSTIINLLHGDKPDYYNSYKVLFGNVISADEDILLGFDDCIEGKGKKTLFAQNGIDSFSLKGERSLAFVSSEEVNFPDAGHYRSMHFDDDQLDYFKRTICATKDSICNFLFAISYASPALLKTIREPITEVEKEINLLLDKTKNRDQVSPFYQSLEIYKNGFDENQGFFKRLDYRIHFEQEKPNRQYIAYVQCENSGTVIYKSRYKLIAIPDRLIMRMTKEL